MNDNPESGHNLLLRVITIITHSHIKHNHRRTCHGEVPNDYHWEGMPLHHNEAVAGGSCRLGNCSSVKLLPPIVEHSARYAITLRRFSMSAPSAY